MTGRVGARDARDHAREGIVEWDIEGKVLYANPVFERLIGAGSAPTVGQSLALWFDGPSFLALQAGAMRHRLGPEILDVTVKGRPCLASVIYLNAPNEDNFCGTAFLCPVDGLPHPVRDVLWMMRRYESLLSVSREVLTIVDDDLKIQYVSPAIRTALGYEPEELIGKTPDHLFVPQDLSQAEQDRQSWSEEPGRSRFVKRRFLSKSGELRDFEGYGIDTSGHPYLNAMVSCLTDVTDKERMHRKLQEGARLEGVGRLAGGIAHDFNNVLTVIQGQVELMLARNTDARQVKGLTEVQAAAERATGLISQLLAFARRSVATPKALDLAALINSLKERIEAMLPPSSHLHLELAQNLPNIFADPLLVEEVLSALVINVSEAMPKGGRLSLQARPWSLLPGDRSPSDLRPGHYVELKVSDTGGGMDEATLQHVFEPFFTTKTGSKSTGMSLASCYGILKQFGGNIEISSVAGQGTTVDLLWPVANAKPEPESATDRGSNSEEAPIGHGEMILLVDDELQVLNSVAEALRSLGYRVAATNGPQEALAWIDDGGHPALLVTDLVMPGLGGEDLAGRIHAKHKVLPVLYISGYASQAVEKNSWLRHGVNFLAKPFSQQALARAVKRLLSNEGA